MPAVRTALMITRRTRARARLAVSGAGRQPRAGRVHRSASDPPEPGPTPEPSTSASPERTGAPVHRLRHRGPAGSPTRTSPGAFERTRPDVAVELTGYPTAAGGAACGRGRPRATEAGPGRLPARRQRPGPGQRRRAGPPAAPRRAARGARRPVRRRPPAGGALGAERGRLAAVHAGRDVADGALRERGPAAQQPTAALAGRRAAARHRDLGLERVRRHRARHRVADGARGRAGDLPARSTSTSSPPSCAATAATSSTTSWSPASSTSPPTTTWRRCGSSPSSPPTRTVSLTPEEVAEVSDLDRFLDGDLGLVVGTRADVPDAAGLGAGLPGAAAAGLRALAVGLVGHRLLRARDLGAGRDRRRLHRLRGEPGGGDGSGPTRRAGAGPARRALLGGLHPAAPPAQQLPGVRRRRAALRADALHPAVGRPDPSRPTACCTEVLTDPTFDLGVALPLRMEALARQTERLLAPEEPEEGEQPEESPEPVGRRRTPAESPGWRSGRVGVVGDRRGEQRRR